MIAGWVAIAFISYREADRDAVSRSDLWTVPAGAARRANSPRQANRARPRGHPTARQSPFSATTGQNWFATPRLWTVPPMAAPRLLPDAGIDGVTASGTLHDQTTPGTTHHPLGPRGRRGVPFVVADGGNDHLYAVPVGGGDAASAIGGERVILGARRSRTVG